MRWIAKPAGDTGTHPLTHGCRFRSLRSLQWNMALELMGRLGSLVVGEEMDGGSGRVVGPRRHPENVTRTRGAFPGAPPQDRDRGLRFGTLEAVVGVHIRMEGWGPRAGELPPIPSAVLSAWKWQRLGGTVPRGRVGQASEGEEPPPRKARGPSSRPAPRLRVTRRVPLRAGFAPALAGRGWRAG